MEVSNGNSILNTSTSEELVDCPEKIAFKVSKFSSSSDDYESISLCKSSTKKINPNSLIRERGYEVNDSDQFSQIIEVMECDNQGKSCNEMFPYTKTACVQRFMKIQLQVFSKNGTSSSLEDFQIPSFCECSVMQRIY